ncbi:MAG: hypothetical protein IIC85_02605 [Chloroflexi bacterium]|nr:hypothetical protein [Chloroflexota bacterium]
MRRKFRRRGMAALAGTMIVSGPVLAACASGPSYDTWAATDGAAGRINLDAVQKAFKESDSVTEFERRVNQIYEGDGMVLIRAEQDGERLTLEAFEDLDRSNDIDEAKDDLLFSIVKNDERNELRGHGANGYYNNSFGGGNFLFTYLLLSSFSRGPYFYQTPRNSVGTLRSQRTNYRGSSTYRSQVSRNSSYFNSKRGVSRSSSISSNRRTYQSTQRQSGAFRTSRTGVRSSFGSRSGGLRGSARSSRGGFGGFGGGQTVIGLNRRDPTG